MKNFLIASLFLALAGFFSAEDVHGQIKTETVEIAHYRQFCEGVVPKKCLLIKREGEPNFKAVQDEIENFEFVPGTGYVLRVEIEKVSAPPRDTSGWIYRLKEIVSTTALAEAARDIDLYGTKWRLVRMNAEAVKEASGAWMAFDGANRRIYGYGGCNSFGGGFELEGDEFKAPQVASTKRACLIDWGVEDGFFKALGQGGKIEVESDSLVIRNEGEELLSFVPYE